MIADARETAVFQPRLKPVMGSKLEGALNLVLFIVLFPLAVVSALSRWLRRKRSLTLEPRNELVPGPLLEDVSEFAREAELDDAAPRFGWGSLDFQRQYAPDLFSSVLDLFPTRANKLFGFPPPFKEVCFESLDGTPLCGHLAARDEKDRPGLVVVHGTFGTGGQALYLDAAIEAFTNWGFNVLAIDLRSWGQSAALSDEVITCGWREAEDVLGAAKYLLENTRTTTVGAIGYSLGGASVMNAAAHERAPELLKGGVFSESGFAEARDVVGHLAVRPPVLSPEFLVYWIFKIGFVIKFRATGIGGTAIATYPEVVAAPRFSVGIDELWDNASVTRRVRDIRVPAFHLHAEDDWVVPVEQAVKLREAALENPHVGVCIRPRGAHCSFDRVMGKWRRDLAQRFFCGVIGLSPKTQTAQSH